MNKLLIPVIRYKRYSGEIFPVLPNIVNGERRGFIKNRDGETVISKLNRELLQDIGQAGYYEVNNIQDKTRDILKEIEKFKRTKVQEQIKKSIAALEKELIRLIAFYGW